mgnify:CR=1 FL=1
MCCLSNSITTKHDSAALVALHKLIVLHKEPLTAFAVDLNHGKTVAVNPVGSIAGVYSPGLNVYVS